MATPTIVRRGAATCSVVAATTFNMAGNYVATTDTAIASGERVLWIMFVSRDGGIGNITETVGGVYGETWTKQYQTTDGTTAVTQALFTMETTGAYNAGVLPGMSMAWGASEVGGCGLVAVKVGAGETVGMIVGTAANGNSTNSNPPSITNSSGASRDLLVVAAHSSDGNNASQASAAPTNYINLTTSDSSGASGVNTAVATRAITVANAASEDPGTFTSATEQWVAGTIGVYGIAGASATSLLLPPRLTMAPFLVR